MACPKVLCIELRRRVWRDVVLRCATMSFLSFGELKLRSAYTATQLSSMCVGSADGRLREVASHASQPINLVATIILRSIFTSDMYINLFIFHCKVRNKFSKTTPDSIMIMLRNVFCQRVKKIPTSHRPVGIAICWLCVNYAIAS